VFNVDLRIDPSRLPESERKDFKQYHIYVCADSANEAYEATLELGKEFLSKYGLTGFEVITTAQSYMDWRIIIKPIIKEKLLDAIEKILEQVLMKHHDDISKQDDDAIVEARDAILDLITKETQ